MDAGSIFLVCFGVVFGSLLIGGWRFGYSLLVCCARRKSSPDRASQYRHRENETVQGRQGSAEASQVVIIHDGTSWKDLVHSPSVPSTSGQQPDPSPQARPVRRRSSTTSQTTSSDSSDKCRESDLIKDPHDLQNMTPIPPVPTKCLSRRVAAIGTQAPPAALLARRSQDNVISKRSARSVASRSSSYCGDADGVRVFTATPPTLTRTRTTSDTGTPSPLRQASRPEFPIDPVPLVPAYLRNPAKSGESPKASLSKAQPPTLVTSDTSGYLITVGKLNQQQIDAAEVKVIAANATIKTPRNLQQARSTEYYKVKDLLSMSPSLRKSPPPKIDTFKTPPSQSSLNNKSRSAGISFTDSLKRLTRRSKATPTDEEASPSKKFNISGPSSYVPYIGSGWSPNEYLTLHNVNQIETPLIEHPAIGPQQFQKTHNSQDGDHKDSTSLLVSHKLKQLDRHHGYKTPRKGLDSRSPPAISGRTAVARDLQS